MNNEVLFISTLLERLEDESRVHKYVFNSPPRSNCRLTDSKNDCLFAMKGSKAEVYNLVNEGYSEMPSEVMKPPSLTAG